VEVRTVDYHTAGEPFRIVSDAVPPIPGVSVLERREHARKEGSDADRLRQFLVNEPRGHADMYGGFVVPPDDTGAAFGVLFWHKDGFSTACGHGTIALGTWAVESGLVDAIEDGDTDVVIDVPSGRVTARVTCVAGEVTQASFRNVPAYVLAREVAVETSRGRVLADLSYGGAIYASVRASDLGLAVVPGDHAALIAAGREVKGLLAPWASHPSDDRLSGIYGTILYDDLGDDAGGATQGDTSGPVQRNVTVFADGEVDRSPCGSGTSARLALLADEGRLEDGQVLTHGSIVGTSFSGRVTEHVTAEGRPAVVTEITGSAHLTGAATFSLDPRDGLGLGFTLR